MIAEPQSVLASEVRCLLRLLNDLHDRAASPTQWATHLVGRVRRLLNARAGFVAMMKVTRADEPEGLRVLAALGFPPQASAQQGTVSFESDPLRRHLTAGPISAATRRRKAIVTLTRRQIASDEAWYAPEHGELLRQLAVDDCVHSVHRLSRQGASFLLGFYRRWGASNPFGPRETTLLHLLHTELLPVYQHELSRHSMNGASITPRMRETLDLLLTGCSEKQAASKLGLSKHTVHVYVRNLYRHYNVNSRSELLSRLLQHVTPGA